MNILDATKAFFSGSVLGILSSSLEESEAATKKALLALVPTVLTKILTTAATVPGASKLFETIRVASQQGIIIDSEDEIVRGDKLAQLFTSVGPGQLTDTILDSNGASITEYVSALSGVKRSSAAVLLSVCTSAALGFLKRYLAAEEHPKVALGTLASTQLPGLKNLIPSQLVEVALSTGFPRSLEIPATKKTRAEGFNLSWIVPAGWSGPIRWGAPTGVAIVIGALFFANLKPSRVGESPQYQQVNQIETTDKGYIERAANKDISIKMPESETLDITAANPPSPAQTATVNALEIPQITDDTIASVASSTLPPDSKRAEIDPEFVNGTNLASNERARAAIESLPTTDVVPNSGGLTAANDISQISLPTGEIIEVARGSLIDTLVKALSQANGIPPIAFDNVTFQSASPKITASSERQLTDLSRVLKAYPAIFAKIVGYTDASGDPQRNLNLSYGRAKVVRQFLVSKGIDASRISVSGKGSENSVASNHTPDGRALNRRIELSVIKH